MAVDQLIHRGGKDDGPDFKDWMTHSEQFSFKMGITNGYGGRIEYNYRALQNDGKGKDKRKEEMPPKRKGEFVGGSIQKPPLRSSVSQPHRKERRDEMVAGGNKIPIQPKLSQQPTRPSELHLHHQSRHRRREEVPKHDEEHRQRKRSVSPQLTSRKGRSQPPQHLVQDKIMRDPSPYEVPVEKKLADPSPYEVPTATKISETREPVKKKKHVKQLIDMSSHDNRCRSYEQIPRWPKDKVHTVSLSSHGLYYTGLEDVTQCHDCEVQIYDWSHRHDPLQRHFEASPNCAFLRREYHYDIEELCQEMFQQYTKLAKREQSFYYWPIPRQVSGHELAGAGFFYTERDVVTQCFTCGCVYDKWKKGDDPLAIHSEISNKCSFLKELQKKKQPSPAIPLPKIDYSNKEARLKSFKHLPLDFSVTKEALADAGFHIVRTSPVTVKCESCDLIVAEWKKGDDPLSVHYQRKPDCPFLKELEGSSPDLELLPPPIMTQEELKSICKQPLEKFEKEEIHEKEDFKEKKAEKVPEVTGEAKMLVKKERVSTGTLDMSIKSSPHFFRRSKSVTQTGGHKSLPEEREHSSLTETTTQLFSLQEDDKLCVVCFDDMKQYAIVPCGHLCVCKKCSNQLTYCPICRVRKEGTLRIFDS